MARVEYKGGKPRKVAKPDGGFAEVGDIFEADDVWVSQHAPLVRAGELEVTADEKPKKAAKKSKDSMSVMDTLESP